VRAAWARVETRARWVRSWPATPRWGLPLLGLALAVTVLPASVPSFGSVTVLVNGREVTLPSPTTSGRALRRARVPWPTDGRLLAVASGRVLDAHWHRGTVRAGRRTLRPGSPLANGAALVVRDGTDAVEASRPVVEPVPAGGLPAIEYDLWQPGTPGLAADAIGLRSGETVRTALLRAPVPAARAPGKVVALTFDDGPDPRFTPAVLTILRQAAVKATFCVVGRWARLHPDLVQAISADGHVLCDHTETHPALDRLPGDQVAAQIGAPADYSRLVTGAKPQFLRPPYGATSPVVVAIAHAEGLRVLQWSVDPQDWTRPGVGTIVTRVLRQVHPGAVVLLHDGGSDRTQTVAALPIIITALRAQGYGFVQPLAG
jgi:peptidoglycan/xylan/chitin deacetylase (PgdA/CDA1 family)